MPPFDPKQPWIPHSQLPDPSPPSTPAGMPASDPSSTSAPTPQQLKSALKAFRKRLKLTQLDDQSRIGKSPMSSGHQSGIVGITPPDQFPRAVWDELVRQGKLKRAGGGLYELVQ